MKAKGILIPTLTLVIIALVTSVLLVVTNEGTKEKIAQLQIEADNASRKEVLPDADSFDEGQTIEVDGTQYTYWTAANGTGYVFSTQYKGYGGPVVVMTGITADGTIAGVKLTEQNETPGLGQKALDASFTGQYLKAIPDNGFEVTKNGASADNQIDAIGGATITSTAVTNSVNQAIEIYKTLTGGAN